MLGNSKWSRRHGKRKKKTDEMTEIKKNISDDVQRCRLKRAAAPWLLGGTRLSQGPRSSGATVRGLRLMSTALPSYSTQPTRSILPYCHLESRESIRQYGSEQMISHFSGSGFRLLIPSISIIPSPSPSILFFTASSSARRLTQSAQTRRHCECAHR